MAIAVHSIDRFNLSRPKMLDICSQICEWERLEYGEGRHRQADSLLKCVERNDSSFFCAIEKGTLVGYAELWQLKSMFYKVLLAGDIAEEQFEYYQVAAKGEPGTGPWYVGSVITAPELKANNLVKSAYVFKNLFNQIYSALLATAYPARVMGVGSSDFGKKLLNRHGFQLISPSPTAKDLRPRYEKRLQALELALDDD